MKWSHVALICAGVFASTWRSLADPFPVGLENPVVALIAFHEPYILFVMQAWYLAMPGVGVLIGGTLLLGVWRVWFEAGPSRKSVTGKLPAWPVSVTDPAPAIVVGELHHPVAAREIADPEWLVIPERGLYTGVAIFGAVGSDKTSACMHPFARQLFSWQGANPKRRPAGLVLEVKGDFCHDIHQILIDAKRQDDYIELSLSGHWVWNPLSAPWLDSYSLAYTISTLLNQLFGKGKDPFWQMVYTNLLKWLIELHRLRKGGWVTLQDVYRCTIDPELFKTRIAEAEAHIRSLSVDGTVAISAESLTADRDALGAGREWTPGPPGEVTTPSDDALIDSLTQLGIVIRLERNEEYDAADIQNMTDRLEAVVRWFDNDWMKLDAKLRTACVEGISSFLSLFDMGDVARVFCPREESQRRNGTGNGDERGGDGDAAEEKPRERHLPPFDALIESGKVLALNMPAGSNPALARAVGVFLKNAWLQTLLRRPAQMKKEPERYFRPAVFICDEYQSFASVGEDDPSGDEKAFAMTRQCRVIPIVATQSISSLRSVLPSSEAWRALLQTLRTRIFLSLSDDASADIASKLCGQVAKMKASYTITESARQAEVSLLSGKAGGSRGSVGTSKSFRESWEALFQPREFGLLERHGLRAHGGESP